MTRDGDKKFPTAEFMLRLVIKNPLVVTGYTPTPSGSEPTFVLPRSSGVAMAEGGSVGQMYMQSCLKFPFASTEI